MCYGFGHKFCVSCSAACAVAILPGRLQIGACAEDKMNHVVCSKYTLHDLSVPLWWQICKQICRKQQKYELTNAN